MIIPKGFRRLKEKHERAIELLELCEEAKWRVKNHKDWADGWVGSSFPTLRRKYLHQSDISLRAYKRVLSRYIDLMIDMEEELLKTNDILIKDMMKEVNGEEV